MKKLTALYRQLLKENKLHEAIFEPHELYPHQFDDIERKLVPAASEYGSYEEDLVKKILNDLRKLAQAKQSAQIPDLLKSLTPRETQSFSQFLKAAQQWTDENSASGNAAVDYLAYLMDRFRNKLPAFDKRAPRKGAP